MAKRNVEYWHQILSEFKIISSVKKTHNSQTWISIHCVEKQHKWERGTQQIPFKGPLSFPSETWTHTRDFTKLPFSTPVCAIHCQMHIFPQSVAGKRPCGVSPRHISGLGRLLGENWRTKHFTMTLFTCRLNKEKCRLCCSFLPLRLNVDVSPFSFP